MSENNSKGFWDDPIEPPRLAYLNFFSCRPAVTRERATNFALRRRYLFIFNNLVSLTIPHTQASTCVYGEPSAISRNSLRLLYLVITASPAYPLLQTIQLPNTTKSSMGLRQPDCQKTFATIVILLTSVTSRDIVR
jgi:hypothetical protein